MSGFWSWLSGGAGKLVESVGGIIDDLNLSGEEKLEFKAKLNALIAQDRAQIEQTVRAELDAKARIYTAELQQGDVYTKRARPTVIYGGLAFIAINHVAVPLVNWAVQLYRWAGAGTVELQRIALEYVPPPTLDLPSEFWWAFTTAFSVYAIGRTAEKRGVQNQFTDVARLIGTGKP